MIQYSSHYRQLERTPVQQRSVPVMQLLIDATNVCINAGGEASVRIKDISATTGVSVGSIYHHFGDRGGLLRATYAHNFSRVVKIEIADIHKWMSGITEIKDIADHYPEMIKFAKAHFSVQPALERVAIVGNVAGRPDLYQTLAMAQHELTDAVAQVLQLAKDKGVLKAHVHPRAGAAVILGMLFGRVIGELDTDPIDDDEWTKAMLSCLGGLFQSAPDLRPFDAAQ